MKWISVKDKLPNDGDYIAIYAPSLDVDCPLLFPVRYKTGNWGVVKYWAEAITHWMILPDPPILNDTHSRSST